MASEIKQEEKREREFLTPEAQESLMISLAIKLAEKQLREGTASSQVISHYLKLGSTRERLEKELLERQIELASAKTESIHDAKHLDEIYENAIEAMKRYSGNVD